MLRGPLDPKNRVEGLSTSTVQPAGSRSSVLSLHEVRHPVGVFLCAGLQVVDGVVCGPDHLLQQQLRVEVAWAVARPANSALTSALASYVPDVSASNFRSGRARTSSDVLLRSVTVRTRR